ncbi:hypothetical protein N0V93_004567 [Gnomoniopsis smithogilvyi]|uniref:NAD-dependent epimerase/dehydratase domain-containing protein n=1 Tax=Gnomoniopsis smithogilvyi TaxID=1191159 RepID=A0A9W8YT37_9PEZI|nr:hypothetical protein N0V93_004567 [Gnomoniopsis smithogilvyi]
MSSHRILVTGASGYLGGTLLARWGEARLASYDKLFALVRTDAQAQAVKQYGVEPLNFDVKDEAVIHRTLVDEKITIVYYLIDALSGEAQTYFIKALAEVQRITGMDVHFLHTSGAKIFSSHAGAPTSQPLLDTDPTLYSIQKAQKAPFSLLQTAVNANCTVTEEGENYGVRTYIFAPCIVYGKGEGFGNPISIQTVAIVKAAQAMRRVYKVDEGKPTWPVCHVLDNITLYIELLRKILKGEDPGHGRNGYFLASSGSIAWDDLYTAMAASLANRNIIGDDSVVPATSQILQQMGEALQCPAEFVPVQIGGSCTFTAEHGKTLGWKPQFSAQHIIETADEEVQHILKHSSLWS